MRRKVYVFILVGILAAFIVVFAKPAVLYLIKKQLSKIFIASTVNISGCDIKLFRRLTLSGLKITRDKVYDFKIKQAKIEFSPRSIIKRNILKFSLSDAKIRIDLKDDSFLEAHRLLNLKTGTQALGVESIELTNLFLDLNSTDLRLKGAASLRLNLKNRLIEYLNLHLDGFTGYGVKLANARVGIPADDATGSFLDIDRLQYNKLKIERIRGLPAFKDNTLSLSTLSAQILGGSMQGELTIDLEKGGICLGGLEFLGINLDMFVNDFNLNEKLQITGTLQGAMAFKTRADNIEAVRGDFTSLEPGGVLTIKDTDYLEKIARSCRQPLDILVESFKNYRYNMGIMRLSYEEGNLLLDIALDGQTGKRNLNVTIHEFRLR